MSENATLGSLDVDFVLTHNGVVIADPAAEAHGFPSRVGQPAPPVARTDCEPLPEGDADVDEAEAAEAAEAPTTDAAPRRTAREVVAALAARRARRQVGPDRRSL